MADSPHFAPTLTRNQRSSAATRCYSKSCTHLFCKFIFFAFFLVAIPLFPSQAPDFFNETVLNKFWELFYLLFIGIAVSYGLFSRRNFDTGTEIHSNNADDSESYVCRVFHVPSIFEDGYENSCVSDEKSVYQTWNTQYYRGEPMVAASSESYVINEQSTVGFFNVQNGFENGYGYNEETAVRAWNSQYFRGESMVFVAQQNNVINEYGESGSIMGYKPLGLPIRSLDSRVRKYDSPDFVNGTESGLSGSNGKDSSNSSIKSRNGKFGDLGPVNLETKFNQTVASPSPIPWRSRSQKMEPREKVNGFTRPFHFRPLSVDETQFESIKSRSLRSTASFSSQASQMSHSPSTGSASPSHSNSSESPNSRMEESESERSSHRSFAPTSPSPPKPVNVKASTNALHARQYSCGSLLENQGRRRFEDELKELCRKQKEDSWGIKDWVGSDSVKFDAKPAGTTKTSLRGKSVRTFRARGYSNGAPKVGEKHGNHTKEDGTKISGDEAACMGKNEPKTAVLDNISVGFNRKNLDGDSHIPKVTSSEHQNRRKREVSENYLGKNEQKTAVMDSMPVGSNGKNLDGDSQIPKPSSSEYQSRGKREFSEIYMSKNEPKSAVLDNMSVGFNRKNLGSDSHVHKPTSSEYQNRGKRECPENSALGPREVSESEKESIRVSSDEETISEALSIAGNDPYEVDKKAGEFIAKFKEQIRLQKMMSVETPRGPNDSGNVFR